MELLMRHRGFRRLWASQAISLFGDWLSFIAISLLALHKGDGAIALAMVLAAHTLPSALAQPLAGVLSDRFDRIKLMMVSNLVQCLLTVGMALAAMEGSMLAVQLLLVLRTAAAALVMTAKQAALPRLVGRDDLYRANAIMSMTWSIVFAGGMALGGALAVLGPTVALLVDSTTFLSAIAFLWGLPVIRAQKDEVDRDPRGNVVGRAFRNMATDLKESVRIAREDRVLLGAVLAKFPLSLASGGSWVLLNLVSEDAALLGGGGLVLGLLHSVRGIGTGLGPWWAAGQIERGRFSDEKGRDVAAWVALASMAVFAALAYGALGWWAMVFVAVFFWGIGTGTNWVLSTAAIQRIASDQVMGRVTALDFFLATSGLALGAVVSALAADWTGEPVAAGVASVLVGAVSWLFAKRVASGGTAKDAELGTVPSWCE